MRLMCAAAERGHVFAQMNIGVMHFEGLLGVSQSDALAVEWYRKAADQGYAEVRLRSTPI